MKNKMSTKLEAGNENKKEQDLRVESLDDLFIDDDEKKEAKQEAPVLPMEDNTPQDEELFSEDLQKQLEAKFDELFGPIDDNNE